MLNNVVSGRTKKNSKQLTYYDQYEKKNVLLTY